MSELDKLKDWIESEPEMGTTQSFTIIAAWDKTDERYYHIWQEVVALKGGDFAVAENCEVDGITNSWQILDSEAVLKNFQNLQKSWEKTDI